MLKWWGSKDIKIAVKNFFESDNRLDNKVAVDIPAGEGVTSEILKNRGAKVIAVDLFPEFFSVEGLKCIRGDLSVAPLDLQSRMADLLICQEGIEHMSDQMAVLREFNRILKPQGLMYITTPSYSHLRSKLSYLLVESEFYKRLPANEIDDIWFSNEGDVYYGHIFLLGIQKLRTLASLSGFELTRVLPTRANYSSLFLGIFLYLPIILANFWAYRNNLRKQKSMDKAKLKKVYWEIFKLNVNPKVLFGSHLFIEFKKTKEVSEAVVQEKKNFKAPAQQQLLMQE